MYESKKHNEIKIGRSGQVKKNLGIKTAINLSSKAHRDTNMLIPIKKIKSKLAS